MVKPKGASDKVKRNHRHSFARQFLSDHNIQMFKGDEQVLEPVGDLYQISLPNTKFSIGEQFIQHGEVKKIYRFDELKDLGFVIISVPIHPNKRWDSGQKVMYLLRKVTETGEHIGKIPKEHYVEYDSYNKALRLIGRRAGPMNVGNWLVMDNSKFARENTGTGISYKTISKDADMIMRQQMNRWKGVEANVKPMSIKEVPFMITDSNQIICFPNTPDMPSILISGIKGGGKSYLLHSLVSRFFWKKEYRYKIAILNDSSRETGPWTLPNSDHDQILTLSRLNERPLPLPCVFFHPLVKEDYEKLFMGNVGFDITIPFKDILENHKVYLNLKDSTRYFLKKGSNGQPSIQTELMEAKDQMQAEEILERMTLHHSIPVQTANKIRAEFDALFDSKMTDISTDGQITWKTSKNINIEYNPFTACIHAGLLPVLETEYISNRPELLSIYFSYIAGDLFNRQKQDPIFSKEQSEILLVIDECHRISGTADTRNSGGDLLLRRCVREGRPRRIGTLLATQKFNELPDVIKGNTTYLICFKNPSEATKIAGQYNLGSHIAAQIKDLDKHQCLAYTTEHFIVYDTNGKKRRSKLNEVFVGKSLPSFSQHKAPKAKE